MNNLFGMGLGGNRPPAAQQALVEFRAGKMTMADNKLVTPDRTKGLVQLIQTPDSLMHFIWKDRTTGTVVDDLIIFPEEASFKKVKQTTARVFLLEFKDSSRKIFFWMQDPKADKDDEYVTKINQFINNPPNPELGSTAPLSPAPSIQTQVPQTQLVVPQAQAPVQQSPIQQTIPSISKEIEMPTLTEEDDDEEDNDELELALQMSMQQSATPTLAHTQPVPSSQPAAGLNVNFLQNILGGMQDLRQQRRNTLGYIVGHNLPRILNSETLAPLVSSPDIVQQLLPHLPEESRTPEELREVIRSPQFQQALQSLGYALETGLLNDILQQRVQWLNFLGNIQI